MSDSGGGDDLLARQKELLSTFRRSTELAEELMAELQAVGRRYEERLSAIERENHTLASLYVAAYQLHISLEPRDVMRTIVEILVNFLGAKAFAVYLLDGGRLRPAAAEGIDLASLPDVDASEPVAPRDPTRGEPIAVRALRLGDRVAGAVAIWDLLQQKPSLDEGDNELLNLLGTHAAVALEAARIATGAGSLREPP